MSALPLELVITDITLENYQTKLEKAIRKVTKHLGVPMAAHKLEHTHEPYLYDVQQELSDRWTQFYTGMTKKVYTAVTEALDLPTMAIETMKKALGDSGNLKYRGKVIYNPSTGQPIKIKEFNALIEAIENFLNRNTKDLAKRIILDAVTIGKLIQRMAKYHSTADMKRLKLDDLKYRGKTFNWIRNDLKNLKTVLGQPLSAHEIGRYQVAQDYVAHLVTRSNNKIREEIKDTVLNGILQRRTKGQVSQDLFNRLGGLNRDWRRIADTEIVNTSNLAGIRQEINDAPKGEKVYFRRYELPGCCERCEKVNGVIALWSDVPLDDDKIKDPHAKVAIWEGKEYEKGRTVLVTGTLHPNCRGGWTRWGSSRVDAAVAQIRGKAAKWDAAVKQAKEEYKGKGIENPNDQTEGYLDRINTLYREKLGEG
jgi:hypothetical protein